MFYKSRHYGQLNIEKVLFEFEREPIVFICKNTTGARFVCVNTGYGFEQCWIVAKVSIPTITRMLRDEISVLDAISKTKNKVLLLKEGNGGIEAISLDFKDIDHSELPDANVKVQNPKCADYIQFLQNEMYEHYTPIKAEEIQSNRDYVIDFVNAVTANIDYSSYKVAGKEKTRTKRILAEV